MFENNKLCEFRNQDVKTFLINYAIRSTIYFTYMYIDESHKTKISNLP